MWIEYVNSLSNVQLISLLGYTIPRSLISNIRPDLGFVSYASYMIKTFTNFSVKFIQNLVLKERLSSAMRVLTLKCWTNRFRFLPLPPRVLSDILYGPSPKPWTIHPTLSKSLKHGCCHLEKTSTLSVLNVYGCKRKLLENSEPDDHEEYPEWFSGCHIAKPQSLKICGKSTRQTIKSSSYRSQTVDCYFAFCSKEKSF